MPPAATERSQSSLDYPLVGSTATDGSVVEVAPGILWARMPMPMALDHINVYLLRGDDGWTLVDTGLNIEAVPPALGAHREHASAGLAHHAAGLHAFPLRPCRPGALAVPNASTFRCT